MNAKLIAVLALAASFGLSPMLLAADKSKSSEKCNSEKAKTASVKKAERGSAWQGKNWKLSATPVRKTAPAVQIVPYQAPAGSSTTQPMGEYTYTLRDREGSYDYFGAHYGNSRPDVGRTATSQPAGVLGYVPPANNSQNPFIYRRVSSN